jgi:membrane-associated HD superfamily phosphohydrolase
VVNKSLARLDGVPFEGYEDYYQHLKDAVLPFIYSKGVFDPSDSNHYATGDDDAVCALVFDDSDELKVPVSEVFTVNAASEYLKKQLKSVDAVIGDSLYYTLNLRSLVIPNLDYNHGLTDDRYVEKVSHPSTTQNYMERSETIVEKGELITDQVANLLDSYKAEYELSYGYTGNLWKLKLSHAIFALVVLLMVYITIYFVNFNILRESNRFNFILLVVLMAFLVTVFARKFSPNFMYMVPYAVFALYMEAFFRNRLVFPVYMIMLLPLLVVSENGVELYILNAAAGGMALVSFSFLYKGWLQFLNSLIIFVGMFVIHMAFRLMGGEVFASGGYVTISMIFANAFLVVAAYPLVFLLEKIFSLVSVATLQDLSDTNNRLLQELARKAPGTFQHSLQVANLAERAVLAIRGNSRLVR